MKFNCRIAASLVVASAVSANAQFVPLTGSESVTASGSVAIAPAYGGESQSYSFTQASPIAFGNFTGNVSGAATATLSIQPPFEIFFGPTLHSDSRASQSTTISASGISATGDVYAECWMNSQIGSLHSAAQSSTKVSFQILAPTPYSLNLSINGVESDGFLSVPQFSLLSSDGTFALTPNFGISYPTVSRTWTYNSTGTLAPGTYALSLNASASSFGDPLGDFGRTTFGMNLAVDPVPDKASTAALLAIGIVALWAMGKVGGERREVRSQESGIRSQESEVRSQLSDYSWGARISRGSL